MTTLPQQQLSTTLSPFARFCIPHIFHTDNGPQFTSKDYMDSACHYQFKHATSSPYHSQDNGREGTAVKVSKSMHKKSDDLQTTLLNCRNTPPKGHTYSSAQCMVSHQTLPTPDHLLEPIPVNSAIVSAEIKSKRNACFALC